MSRFTFILLTEVGGARRVFASAEYDDVANGVKTNTINNN